MRNPLLPSRAFLTFAAVLLGAGAIHATEYHVSVKGDGTGNGTAETPFHTIQAAANKAQPGDIITVHEGTYREHINLRHGGASDTRPITYQSASGKEVILKGSDIITNWQITGNDMWRRPDWTINSQQLFVDGTPLQQIGTQSPWNTLVTDNEKVALPPVGRDIKDVTPGTFYYDAKNRALYCMLGDRSDPNGHTMEASVRDSVMDGEKKNNVVVRGLTFMHSNGTAKGGWAGLLRVIGGSGWIVEDCTFAWGDFAGATLSGDGHIVRRCRFIHNGDQGISLNGSDAAHQYKRYMDSPRQNVVFEDLTVTDNNYRHFYEDWEAGGMKLSPSIRAVTVRRCYIANNRGPGIWFDGDLGGNIVEDNVIARNRTGIFYEISEPSSGDPFGIRIRNNRVVANTNQGIYISASRGAIVENNTCFRNRWDIVMHGMQRRDFGYDMWLKDNVVRANIVNGRDADVVVFVGACSANNTVDGNFYATTKKQQKSSNPRPAGVAFSATTDDYSVTQSDLGSIFTEQGFEQHGRSGDPQWVNTDGMDFNLLPGSTAKGMGWQQKTAP